MKYRALKSILTTLLLINFILSISFNYNYPNENIKKEDDINIEYLEKKEINLANYQEVYQFKIDDTWPYSSESKTWEQLATEPWCTGSGTWSEPYIIENIKIIWANSSLVYSIEIRDSNVHYIIRNITTFRNGRYMRGLSVAFSTNGLIYDNIISNTSSSGINIVDSNNITIRDNFLEYNSAGINLLDSRGIYIKNNTLRYNGYGIYATRGWSTLIKKNRVNKNTNGIYVIGGHEYVIYNNTASKNIETGISIPTTYNINVSHNIICNNKYDGVCLEVDSHDNLICRNIIENNSLSGIKLYSESSFNNFTKNLIKDNKQYGVLLSEGGSGICRDNIFYNNTFIQNGINAEGRGFNNWNNSEIGNYWDDYDGLDKDDNGIGDSPYFIPSPYGGDFDYLPIWFDGPEIQIYKPYENQMYGTNLLPPNFSIETIDPNLDTLWYTINYQQEKYIISENGTIDLDLWASLSDGLIIISFFANDTFNNINYNSISIIKDTLEPVISINYPLDGEIYSFNAPSFNVSISDLTLNTTWYTIDLGLKNHTFYGSNILINEDSWDSCEDGFISLKIYANDSFSRISFNETTIVKDTLKPEIEIIEPFNFSIFNDNFTTPKYVIEIEDPHLDSIWYTINNGITKYFITENGTIDSSGWNTLPNGNITIRFYANDTVGNINFKEVIVIKNIDTKNNKNPSIIGFDFSLLICVLIFSSIIIILKFRDRRV